MSTMWKNVNNTHYFLCFSDKLEVFVTDFVTIWCCYLADKSFLASLKDSNFALYIDANELIEKGKWMLTNPDKLKKVSVTQEDRTLCMSMTMKFDSDLPLNVDIKVIEGTKELKVSLHLLKTIHNLKASQDQLRHLLLKKDEEIKEYKCEGGKIDRHFKTILFNNEAHMSKYNVYEDNFGSSDLPDSLLTKVVHVPEVQHEVPETNPVLIAKSETKTHIKQEAIKSEPLSESSASLVSPRKKLRRKFNI